MNHDMQYLTSFGDLVQDMINDMNAKYIGRYVHYDDQFTRIAGFHYLDYHVKKGIFCKLISSPTVSYYVRPIDMNIMPEDFDPCLLF